MIDTARSRYPADLVEQAGGERDYLGRIAEDVAEAVKRYAREKPSAALLSALGIGFVLGWKLGRW